MAACAAFVAICRNIGLLTGGVVAVDGSRFKAVNTRDKNYTPAAVRRRIEQAEASIERYLQALDTWPIVPRNWSKRPSCVAIA